MTHTKANKSKILALILGLTMCLALMLGIVFRHIPKLVSEHLFQTLHCLLPCLVVVEKTADSAVWL